MEQRNVRQIKQGTKDHCQQAGIREHKKINIFLEHWQFPKTDLDDHFCSKAKLRKTLKTNLLKGLKNAKKGKWPTTAKCLRLLRK